MVALNKPYAGGYITEHYGRPHKAQHALQIEINRALYMDETSFDKSAGFDGCACDLEAMVRAAHGRASSGLPSPAPQPNNSLTSSIKKGPLD